MRLRSVFLMLCMALLVACGSSGASTETQATAPTATTAPTNTPVPTNTPAPTATTAPTNTPEPTIAPEVVAADVNDQAHLEEGSAPPTENVQPVAALPTAQPVRIQIPAIKLDYKPVPVGLDKNKVPIVPKHDVGWYTLSAVPGQGENIVFWGHVLRFKATPKIPAPFARVKELKPGAELLVTTSDGTVWRYAVVKAFNVTPDQVQYVLPTGKEQITLVSCIGDNVIVKGEFTKKFRLVTIAEPIK